MSNLETAPRETPCGGVTTADGRTHQVLSGRDVPLGRYTMVRRFLPERDRRMVGAWCFVDHYGPDAVLNGPGMRVPPHPHIGLQTVSWLLAGEVLHRDSLGSEQILQPGALGLMTAGRGIAHSEESPRPRTALLHGLQLWVALPAQARHGEAAFDYHADLPVLRDRGLTATVLAGELAGTRSPARVHTPLVGADLALDPGAEVALPLDPDFEFAAVVVAGPVELGGHPVGPGTAVYLGRHRSTLALRSEGAGRLMLLGGEPFEERLVMWWNFVARTHEEIAQARQDWAAGRRFGVVRGYDGDPLPAPPLPATRLVPRARNGSSRS